ncbi:MAG: AAA family ATPase [Oscillospiraceae bacterium]|nr:AAA family ATPase [Oscillospiraceae bacterium]
MEIRKLQASFGRLDGAELELHSGLNVIEAPNESGKSTWAAFLRAMLYGVSTSDRVRNGVLPDRMRYQPWSGAPMAGLAELRWREKDITLRRVSPGGGKPMGNAEAVYTGTEERVPELRAGVPGEIILGVPEAVFRRSAFISGADMALDANSELEKKITRLVTSGEERSSYTEADERLRRWQRKRRWRTSGSLPEAEARRKELQGKLLRIESENKRLSELREEKGKLTEQREVLENELALHRRDERREEARRREEAIAEAAEAARGAEEARARLRELEGKAENLSSEKVQALRAAAVRLEEAAHDRDTATAAYEEAKKALEALPKPEKQPNPKKGTVLALFILGVLALLAGAAAGLGFLSLPVGYVYGIILLALMLLFAACLCSFSGRKAAREKEAAMAHERELKEQAAQAAEKQLDDCRKETDACAQARREALAALGEGPEAEPEEAAVRAEALLRELRDAQIRSENAEALAQRLRAEPAPPPEPIPEDALTGEPRIKKEAAEDYLRRTADKLREVSRDLDRGEGIFDLLGDPLLLATEEANLTEDIHRMQEEYDALELALDALREANTQLQTLFSPLISRRAAALMARMTDSRYAGVYFDREMHFSAQRAGELNAHALEYLSDGTRNQLYLAVRLAICELVLTEEPCPLILDDVLAAFDDKRARDTLQLLRELAQDRQIILLTCQSRERRLLAELEKEA